MENQVQHTLSALPKASIANAIQIQDWGLIPYGLALERQLQLVDEVSIDVDHPGYLIFCSHPPIVTTGRQTLLQDVFSWNGEITHVSRGGRATYHGPSQIVIYPIINIRKARKHRGPQEIRGFLRDFENGISEALKIFKVLAKGKDLTFIDDTGVWVTDQNGSARKIASLGIAVKKWTTYHGAAINIDFDPNAFSGINPCGFETSKMISLEELLCQKIVRTELIQELKTILSHYI